jgi:DNA-binding NarL/FixJ family response regulator
MGPAKILSVGLGDLVSCRETALRTAGFEVVAALCLQDLARACASVQFDVAIVGYAFSVPEKAQFVRCLQGVFRLPVILITSRSQYLASIRADSYVSIDAPFSDLLGAISELAGDQEQGPQWSDQEKTA